MNESSNQRLWGWHTYILYVRGLLCVVFTCNSGRTRGPHWTGHLLRYGALLYSEMTKNHRGENNWLHAAVILEKLTVAQLLKKFPEFYRNRRFITVITRARHLSLSWTSHPISLWSIEISYHLQLGLPSGLFPSGFSTKILYPFIISPISAKYPAHLILLDLITLIIFSEE
jgi:hypothetical protein